MIEVLDRSPAAPEQLAALAAAGIPLLTGHTPRLAESGRDGVERLRLTTDQGGEVAIECDTVCLAFGLAPAIELLERGRRPDRPRRPRAAAMRRRWTAGPPRCPACSPPAIAPVWPASEAEAAEQGRQAARQALGGAIEGGPRRGAGRLGLPGRPGTRPDPRRRPVADRLPVRGGDARGDLLEVRAPRYLGEPTAAAKARDLGSLIADGPPNQDQVKRLTRAGMGPCQGRRCREQVALTLALAPRIAPARGPARLPPRRRCGRCR